MRLIGPARRGGIARVLMLATALSLLGPPILQGEPLALAATATFTPVKQDTTALGTPAPNIVSLTFDGPGGVAGTSSGAAAQDAYPSAGTTWTSMPTGSTQSLNAVGFTDYYHGYVADAGGTIRYTTNSGQSWAIANTVSGVAFNGMACRKSLTTLASCVVVGSGGNVWFAPGSSSTSFAPQTLAPSTTANLFGVSCDGNSNLCAAVGQNATVILGQCSSSACSSWQTVTGASGFTDDWHGISCVAQGPDPNIAGPACYSVGDGGVYASIDSGATWALKISTAGLNFAPKAVLAQGAGQSGITIYVAGGSNGFAASNDAGATWSTYSFNPTDLTKPHALAALNQNSVYVGGDSGSLVALTVTFSTPPVPTVTSISPTSGPAAGGTTVTITGTNFSTTATGTSVSFGGAAATNVSCTSTSQCTAVSPPGSGIVHVTVSTAGGTSATGAADQFTYTGSTSSSATCNPTSVQVNTPTTCTVSVIDTSTTPTTPTGTVAWTSSGGGTFSATSCTLDASGRCSITYTPSATGAQTITATYGGDTTHARSSGNTSLTVTAPSVPTVSSISPTSGPSSGGTTVIITGTRFTGATAVWFGTTAAASFTVNSDTQITAVCPAGPAGSSVDVTVSVGTSTSATSAADRFTYGAWAYVANQQSNTVSVIDTTRNTVIATVPVGTTPRNVVISADGTRVLVTNKGSNSVSVIDTSTNSVIGTPVPVQGGPDALILSPDGTRVYVANATDNSISVIETTGYTVVATVAVGITPTGLAVTPDGSRLYVTNQGSNSTSVIDTTAYTVLSTVPVGTSPYGVAVKP